MTGFRGCKQSHSSDCKKADNYSSMKSLRTTIEPFSFFLSIFQWHQRSCLSYLTCFPGDVSLTVGVSSGKRSFDVGALQGSPIKLLLPKVPELVGR